MGILVFSVSLGQAEQLHPADPNLRLQEGVAAFVQGQSSKDTLVQGAIVHEDFYPRRHWSKETFVKGASLTH